MNLEQRKSQRHKVTMLNTPRPKVKKRGDVIKSVEVGAKFRILGVFNQRQT